MKTQLLSLLVLMGCSPPGGLLLSTELVDFGPALPGVERTQAIELVNRTDATQVVIVEPQTSGVFSLDLPRPITLVRGEARQVDVRYRPADGATGPDEATFEFLANAPGIAATLRVKGQPTTPLCGSPGVLDFGLVARGDSHELTVPIINSTDVESLASVSVEAIQGEGTFTVSGDGSFPVGRYSTRTLTVTFAPTEAREYSAVLLMKRHPLCAGTPIRLIGTGVAAVFSWTPPIADFGQVAVGATARVSIVFSNSMFRPLPLTQLRVSGPDFAVAAPVLGIPAAHRDETGVVIPGMAAIQVSFHPSAPGAQATPLLGSTDLSSQPALNVLLRGMGM